MNLKFKINTNHGIFTSFEEMNDYMIKNNVQDIEILEDNDIKTDCKVIELKK